MYKTHQLVLNYKKLILAPLGFYMLAGLVIFLVYSMQNSPLQVGLPILGFATDLLFSFNSTHSFFNWFLLFLSLILGLSVQPIFASSWFAVSRITSPGSFLFSDNFDLMTGDPVENTPSSKTPQSRTSSLNAGNKGMIMVADGKIMFINKEFCQITGYSAVDIIGKDFVEFIVPQDILKYASLIRTPQNEAPGILGIGFTCENGREIEVYIAGNKNSSANPNDICLFYAREKDVNQVSQLSVTDWFVDSFNKTNTFFWMWDEKE
ncbi:MAG: PAS domain-containing protein [Bacteroidales bacterium]|nr:PAS domain-containing protein [Bacteroidales bacterium]